MNMSTYQPTISQEEYNSLLTRHKELKKQLNQIKKDELEVRLQLDAHMFNPTVESGTQNFDLGGGWVLKSTRRLNYKLDTKGYNAISDQLDPAVVERLTKTSLKLDLKEYDRLQEKAGDGDQFAQAQLRLLADVITTSKGTPSIELIEPKGN